MNQWNSFLFSPMILASHSSNSDSGGFGVHMIVEETKSLETNKKEWKSLEDKLKIPIFAA